MPIKAAQSSLRSQIKSALSMGQSALPESAAAKICKAIASAASKGLRPIRSKPYYVPLVPSGVAVATGKMSKGFKALPQDSDIAASKFASAVAAVAPKCKSIGKSTLESKLKKSFRLSTGNEIDKTANDMSSAIISYFLAGGIK